MKQIFAVLVAVVMLFSAVSAQDFQMKSLGAGDESINFTFGGLGNFGLGAAGISGGISGTYFLSGDAAVRVGLQVASSSSTTPANPAAGQTGKDGESSSFALGLGGDYLMYLKTSGRVRTYVGGGLQISMSSNSSKSVVNTTAGVQTETKNVSPAGTTFGLMGIAGAEFFIYPELSISGEYNLNLFSLTSKKDTEVTTGSTTVTTKNGSSTQLLGFGAAGATVHIYF